MHEAPDLVVFNAGNNRRIDFRDLSAEQFEDFWRVGCFGGNQRPACANLPIVATVPCDGTLRQLMHLRQLPIEEIIDAIIRFRTGG